MTTPMAGSGRQSGRRMAPDSHVIRWLTCEADCTPRDWLMAVNRRPALCHGIVRAINACPRAVPRPVASVSQAVAQLGFNTVRNLARTLMT